MHGFGVYLFANGHRYEGAWHEGRRQGLGMYTFRNGETKSGHWQNGFLDIPTAHNARPESPCAVNFAKVLNAVQVTFLLEQCRNVDFVHTLCRYNLLNRNGLADEFLTDMFTVIRKRAEQLRGRIT